MFSRTSKPFLTAIASLTLITSGVFAVAPYVAFLSSVAALNIASPVIFILFALSAVVIVFSYKNDLEQKDSIHELEKHILVFYPGVLKWHEHRHLYRSWKNSQVICVIS